MIPGGRLMRDGTMIVRHPLHRHRGMRVRLQLLRVHLGATAGKRRETQRPGDQDGDEAGYEGSWNQDYLRIAFIVCPADRNRQGGALALEPGDKIS